MSNESKLRVRRMLTAEFKREAVELIRKQGLSVAEAARRLDVRETLLRRWRKELEATKAAGTSAVASRQPWKRKCVNCGKRSGD